MKFPPVDFKKIVDSDVEIEDSPISTNVNMNFGKDCKTDHKVTSCFAKSNEIFKESVCLLK